MANLRHPTLDERINFLENLALFSNFNNEEITGFLAYTSIKHVESGETVIKEGERNSGMAFLFQGEVDIIKKDDRNQDKKMAHFGKGKVFGEMSVLDGQPSSASVVATEDATLLILTDSQFKVFVSERPRIAVKILLILGKTVSGRLRMTSGRLVEYLD